MPPIARILAATDLSAPARHAVERGFRLAAGAGANYRVMHALELDAIDRLREWLGEGAEPVRQQLEQRAREALRQLLDDPVRNRGVRAEARLEYGLPLAAILDQAAAFAAELLVLGARGDAFMRHLLPGTTTSRLLRKATGLPILVVKQPPHEDYRRLLVAVDFSPVSVHALRLARRLAPQAELFVVHSFAVPFDGKLAFAGVDAAVIDRYREATQADAERQVALLAREAGLGADDFMSLVLEGDPAQQLLSQEQELDCDLIVIGKHGRGVSEELLLGSVTKHVLAGSQGDVLVVTDALPHGDSLRSQKKPGNAT